MLAAAAVVTTVVVMGAPQGAAAREGGLVNDPAKEAEFVARINDLRADQGLVALKVHNQLVAKARDWAETMGEAGEIWHSHLPDGVTVKWRRLGENVGMGGTVDALHEAFVASPGHYENLIDPGFRYVGIGVFLDAEGTIFVSEVFMELASQPAPATPAPTTGTPSSSPGTAQPISNVTPGSEAADGERFRGDGDGAAVGDVPGPSPRLTSVLDRLHALDY